MLLCGFPKEYLLMWVHDNGYIFQCSAIFQESFMNINPKVKRNYSGKIKLKKKRKAISNVLAITSQKKIVDYHYVSTYF